MGSKEATRARASALLVLTSQVVTPWLNLTDVFIDYAPAFPLSICITTFVRKPSENIIGTIKANLWCCQHSIHRRQTILISALASVTQCDLFWEIFGFNNPSPPSRYNLHNGEPGSPILKSLSQTCVVCPHWVPSNTDGRKGSSLSGNQFSSASTFIDFAKAQIQSTIN